MKLNEARYREPGAAGRGSVSEIQGAAAGGTAPRIRAIDLARGVAVILMVAAHAADVFVADTWRHNDIWYRIDLLFGFVAPAFTFLSGVTIFIALGRNARALHHTPFPFRAITGRLLTILALGYWLQLPNRSLRQLIYNHEPAQLAQLFDANILQVIALAGLLSVAFAWALRFMWRARIAALVAGIAAIIATPYLWASGIYQSLPLSIRFYLAPQPPATFGLLPSLAYFMLGFACAETLIAAGRSWRGIVVTAAAGAALVWAGLALDPILHAYPPQNDFWWSSSQHIVFRAGGLYILMAICAAAAMFRPSRNRIMSYIGRHSLAIYILHLMLFYGSPVTIGMRVWFGGIFARTLGPATVAGIIIATLALCVALLRGWETLARSNPAITHWAAWIAWSGFAAMFLLKP